MISHLEQALAFDVHVRRDVHSGFPGGGIEVYARDIEEGVVYDEDGVRITAFLVDHGPVKPAFGYRVDWGALSVGFSGDTRPS